MLVAIFANKAEFSPATLIIPRVIIVRPNIDTILCVTVVIWFIISPGREVHWAVCPATAVRLL